MKLQEKQLLFLISTALVIATLAAYEPIRHNDFVNYDDVEYVKENPYVTGGITGDSILWALTNTYKANWHPVTWLSHILDCQIFGLKPFGHHSVSVLIHIINAILLLWLLIKMTDSTPDNNIRGQASSPQAGSIWPSAFVAAVFALHPIQVESVAWAAQRKTVLSGLFWLLTTAVYVWYARRPGIWRYIPVFIVYGLCIMTKPAVVTLPLVLLLLDYWPLERWGNNNNHQHKDGGFRGRLIIEKIPLFALSAFLSVITVIAQRGGGAVAGLELFPLDARIANTFVSYIKYVYKIIWPGRLAVFYPHPLIDLTNGAAIGCLLLFILITVFCLFIGRRKKYAITGWVWYVITLIPMAGLVQAGSQAMADRYMYMSIPGLAIIAVWAAKDLIAKHPYFRQAATVASVAILTALVILTRTQVGYWRNSMTLWEHALNVTKNNAAAHTNYANALYEQGRFAEAETHLRTALQISPQYSKARLTLGYTLLKQNKPDEAVDCFKEYLKMKPDSAKVYYDLAFALGIRKKYDEALKALTAALKIDPNLPEIHKRMGDLLLRTEKFNEAVEHYNEALKTSDDKAQIYSDLGSVYSLLGKHDRAIENWTKALELSKAGGQKELADKIESELELYKKGQQQ